MTYQAQYDDSSFDYKRYWDKRSYEHQCEKIAIEKLIRMIPNNYRENSLEIGSGFGRLVKVYAPIFKSSTLLEPSEKQLLYAKERLVSYPCLIFRKGYGENIPYQEHSFDVVFIVRVMHHLIEPQQVLQEAFRVLKPGGFLVLEFANKSHFKLRLTAIFNKQLRSKIFSLDPIDRRSRKSILKKTIPFFNYHPSWVKSLVKKVGFKIIEELSVSNFRIPIIKSLLPVKICCLLESLLQPLLAKISFGPSIFLLLKKPISNKNLLGNVISRA